jgi:hypothetical protein
LSPHFSIDLEAELRKISQRQHLNQVHFLVALVRHALTCEPKQIQISLESQRILLHQDGHAFSYLERAMVLTIMDRGQSNEERQMALSKLEKLHGVSILSLFFNFKQVTIYSGNWCLRWREGKLSQETLSESRSGYQILIEQTQTPEKKAIEELRFYTGDCDIPVLVNGQSIAQPFQFDEPILVLDFENPQGRSKICIPAKGDLSTVTFMKRGVRFGVTRTTPESGLIYQASWSSHLVTFEGHFNKSIQQGFKVIEQQCEALYDAVRTYFPKLPEAHKQRVKRILAGAMVPDWMSRFGQIPLFHSTHQNYLISMRDLRLLTSRFGYVPYVTQKDKTAPGFIPHLLPEDVHFLRDQFKLQLTLFQGTTAAPNKLPNYTATPALEPEQLVPIERLFLKALNADDPYCRFAFSQSEHAAYVDDHGIHHVRLARDHALVKQAIQAVERDATLALPWKFRLMNKLQLTI